MNRVCSCCSLVGVVGATTVFFGFLELVEGFPGLTGFVFFNPAVVVWGVVVSLPAPLLAGSGFFRLPAFLAGSSLFSLPASMAGSGLEMVQLPAFFVFAGSLLRSTSWSDSSSTVSTLFSCRSTKRSLVASRSTESSIVVRKEPLPLTLMGRGLHKETTNVFVI